MSPTIFCYWKFLVWQPFQPARVPRVPVYTHISTSTWSLIPLWSLESWTNRIQVWSAGWAFNRHFYFSEQAKIGSVTSNTTSVYVELSLRLSVTAWEFTVDLLTKNIHQPHVRLQPERSPVSAALLSSHSMATAKVSIRSHFSVIRASKCWAVTTLLVKLQGIATYQKLRTT